MIALALLLLVASPATSYLTEVRTEARARSAQAGEPRAVQELQVDGALGGDASWPILHVFAAYQPRLRVDGTGDIVEALHRGEMAAQWNTAPGRTIRVDQRGFFGRVEQSALNATTQQVRLPPVRTAQELQSSTEASWDETLSRRLRILVAGAFDVSGGADAQSRVFVPLQYGPRGSARVTWDASPLDVLEAQIAGSSTAYSTGGSAAVGSAEAAARRRLSRDASREATAGAGTASNRGRSLIVPVASVRATLNLPERRLLLDSSFRVAPAADNLSAAVYERAEASVGARYMASQTVALDLHVGGAAALPDVAGERSGLAQGQLSASVALSRVLSADAGTRAAWSANPLPGEPPWQWLLFASLSFRGGGAAPDRGAR